MDTTYHACLKSARLFSEKAFIEKYTDRESKQRDAVKNFFYKQRNAVNNCVLQNETRQTEVIKYFT